MRITTITSSIIFVVSRVIDVVAVAGTVRTFLHLTGMREPMGLWQAPSPFGFAYAVNVHRYPLANRCPGNLCFGKPYSDSPDYGAPSQHWHRDAAASIVCLTPSRNTSVRATGRS